MDTRKVFRRLSQKMIEDFKISAEITHSGSKGVYRENALKDFLSDRRLPSRYGIGSGEIVGPARNVSRQSDLIVYDHLNGIALIYDEDTQVYPIECVAGTVEVKSTLNKTELINALENIKSVKELAPRESTTRQSLGIMSVSYPRPLPFGAVFAYQLGDNSLSSLVDNLRDWERSVAKEHWPNVVAILDTGLIQHYTPNLRVSPFKRGTQEGYSPIVDSLPTRYSIPLLLHPHGPVCIDGPWSGRPISLFSSSGTVWRLCRVESRPVHQG